MTALNISATRQSLGLIGVGAFGGFAVPHLAPHYDLVLYDPANDVAALAKQHGAKTGLPSPKRSSGFAQAGDLRDAAMCDVVVLAVPVQKLESVLREIAPVIKPGALVVDVASVKIGPAKLMQEILPAHAALVGTHPLFGPQSGKDGIAGLNIAVCDIRGGRGESVARFLADSLRLNVLRTTPEAHDRELAYVQGLTHLIAKVIVSLDLPQFRFTTRTYDYMAKMVDMVRHDSDELFHAIERENPFTAEAKKAFFDAARRLEDRLGRG